MGDFSNPPTLDPRTGVRVGLAPKPEETPEGARLVAQTETSDTFALADGKFLLRFHAQAVNWRDQAGSFRRLDLSLAKGGDGRWRPRSSPVAVSLADSVPAGGSRPGSGGRLAQLDGPGWSVGFDLAGAPALSLKNEAPGRVSYSLGAGVSLIEAPTADGLKEGIRLDRAPAGAGDVAYTFPLEVRGVAPSGTWP